MEKILINSCSIREKEEILAIKLNSFSESIVENTEIYTGYNKASF